VRYQKNTRFETVSVRVQVKAAAAGMDSAAASNRVCDGRRSNSYAHGLSGGHFYCDTSVISRFLKSEQQSL